MDSAELNVNCGLMQEIIATTRTIAPAVRLRELELNRPNRRNALNLGALQQILELCSDGPEPEQLLLTGRGPCFCSGLDLNECRRVSTWPVRLRHLELLEQVYSRLLMSSAFTIALVQGAAVGGGVGLAACADWVIARADARFRIPGGELFRLARLVLPVTAARQAASRQVECWLAGETDAAGACACGLVDEVLKPIDYAERLAELRTSLLALPAGRASWRTPAICQRVMTEMQEVMAAME